MSSGSWPKPKSTPSAGVTAAARLAGGARPPGIAKQSATTESGIAGSSDEARPPGIEKHSAVTERELAEGSDGVGPLWSRASRDSAAAAADVKSAGKARDCKSATTEPEFAEICDEVGPSWSKANGMDNAAARIIEAPETARQDQHTVELARNGFLRGCVTRSAENIWSVSSSCGCFGMCCALGSVCSPHCGELVERRRGLPLEGI